MVIGVSSSLVVARIFLIKHQLKDIFLQEHTNSSVIFGGKASLI